MIWNVWGMCNISFNEKEKNRENYLIKLKNVFVCVLSGQPVQEGGNCKPSAVKQSNQVQGHRHSRGVSACDHASFIKIPSEILQVFNLRLFAVVCFGEVIFLYFYIHIHFHVMIVWVASNITIISISYVLHSEEHSGSVQFISYDNMPWPCSVVWYYHKHWSRLWLEVVL